MSFSRSTDCFYPDGLHGFVLGSHDHVKPESKSIHLRKLEFFMRMMMRMFWGNIELNRLL